MAMAWNTTVKPSQAQSDHRSRDRLGVAMSKAEALHGKQFAFVGLARHATQVRRSENVAMPHQRQRSLRPTGLLLPWPDQPEHTQQSKTKNSHEPQTSERRGHGRGAHNHRPT